MKTAEDSQKQFKARYEAFKAKDSRFDGNFFVGVSSTGIYCRPVCRAKLPKEENCTFFTTAAAAEHAGYRPCLLCRPEIAPGLAVVDAKASLAERAARLMEGECDSGQGIDGFAKRLNCTGRHLRRAFTAEYSVSPIQYLQTCRLLLAKNLLTDTDLSVIDVAMTAGFGSLRRFNALFKSQYRLAPTALRKGLSKERTGGTDITLALGYRPPYDWQKILDFLALRAIPGVETIIGNEYLRTVRLSAGGDKSTGGFIKVGNRAEENALSVTVSAPLLPVLSKVLSRVRNLFDLYAQPDVIFKTLSSMNDIRAGLCVLGTRLPGCFDPFEMSVRAVLGQQITVKAASTLAGRLVEKFGIPISTGIDGLTHVFPTAESVAGLGADIEKRFGEIGIIKTRANTVLRLAEVVADGGIDFSPYGNVESETEKLMSIPGIGQWTAQYIAMRAMGHTDAFPHTDYGIKKALEPMTADEILRLSARWRPWRSYAAINLWNSL